MPTARDIVPNVNRITQAVRDGGGTIVYLRFKTDAQSLASWSSFYEFMFDRGHRDEIIAAFGPDCHHFALWPALDVQPRDWVVDKTRYSAFVPDTCNLHDRLKAAGIDALIITGTLTNCCCESTARDAMQRDFRVVFVSDGNAALTDAEHNATLGNMVALFADVMDNDEVMSDCAVGSADQARAATSVEAV